MTRIKVGKYTLNIDKYNNNWITEEIVPKESKTSDNKPYELRVSGYYDSPIKACEDMVIKSVGVNDTSGIESACKVINDTLRDAINILEEYNNDSKRI